MKQTTKLSYLLLAFMLLFVAGMSYLFITDNALSLYKGLPRTAVFGIEPAGIKFLGAAALFFGSVGGFGYMIGFKRKHYRERRHYLLFAAGIGLLTLSGLILSGTQAAVKYPVSGHTIFPLHLPLVYGAAILFYIGGLLVILQVIKDDIAFTLHQLFGKGTRNFFECFEEYLETLEEPDQKNRYKTAYMKLLQFHGDSLLSFRQFDEIYLERLVYWMRTKGYTRYRGLDPDIIRLYLSQYREVFEYAHRQYGKIATFPLKKLEYSGSEQRYSSDRPKKRRSCINK